MHILHFEGGLGNQMLDYCDYLAIKKTNPDKKCYAETIFFDIPECQKIISSWNGFELERIFGIQIPNIKNKFDYKNWRHIIHCVKKTEFWIHGWSYPSAITEAFENQGLQLENHCISLYKDNSFRQIFNFMKNTRLWSEILIFGTDYKYKPRPEQLFYKSEKNIYAGHTLQFMYNGNNIEKIEKDIRKVFVFPKANDHKNKEAIEEISNCNSVGIHIRKDDAIIGVNRSIFLTGYYKHAINLIKSKISSCVFYIFGTPQTIVWVKNNLNELGLNAEVDLIKYVDWNSGVNSYRDMQLLSLCKHNIISCSSFGWWGSYLNSNPNKITISPLKKMNTTHHI